MKKLFFGGIHPADQKEMSEKMELKRTPQPKQVTILMSQHIGTPCVPLVKVGEGVKKGQKIGDGEGMCVPVHASVSGKVVAIEPRRHPNGSEVMAVIIENDYREETDASMECYEDYSKLADETVIEILREAGIVGMGGAAFATNIKAVTAKGRIETLIANACECEPYITSDDLLLRTFPERVLHGIRIIGQILKPRRIVLAIEANKKTAIEVWKKELGEETGIEWKVLPVRYPQGSEKQLVQAVTGKEIAPGELPHCVGAAVFNVTTFACVYDAVCLGKPVTERIVTLSGEGIANPGNFIVKIGTGFQHLTDVAGGLTKKAKKVIAGGPMMGVAQKDLSACTVKALNSIVCLAGEESKEVCEGKDCIRCGACVKVCPMKLQPLYLFAYERKQNKEKLKKLHIMDCIECGCCSYICPEKLPLVENIRKGKGLVREEK